MVADRAASEPPGTSDPGAALDLGPPPETIVLDASGGVAQDGAPADRAEAVLCTPRKRLCHPFQAAVVVCNDAGDGWSPVEDCGANGLVCKEGACVAAPSPTSTGGGCSSRSGTGASAPVVAIGLLGLLAALVSNRSSAANRARRRATRE